MADNTLQAEHDAKRKEYLAGELSHANFYSWLASRIGVTVETLSSAVRERLPHSTDEYLNDIPLLLWDRHDGLVRSKAARAGMRAWSLSDTVCVLKAVARAEKTAAERMSER